VAFAWLCTTAVREAIKLDRRTARTIGLDQVAEVVPDPMMGQDAWLGVLAAGDQIRAAGLRPREARVLGLRVVGYSREEITGLTGNSTAPSTASSRRPGAS
jgi:hypothetical protein